MRPSTAEYSVEIPSEVFFGSLAFLWWAFIGAIGVTLIILLVQSTRPRYLDKQLNALALRTNLELPDSLRPALAHHVALRMRGALIASMVVFPAFLVWLAPWSPTPREIGMTGGILGFALVVTAQTFGSVAGGLIARRSAPTPHRSARLSPPDLSALLAPIERRFARITAVSGTIAPLLLSALLLAPWARLPEEIAQGVPALIAFGLASGALYLALPAIGRALAIRRAIPGDDYALAWSDVLASRTLRDLWLIVVWVGGMTTVVSVMNLGFALPADSSPLGLVWANIVMIPFPVTLFFMVVVIAVKQPERHVQRTLWPELAVDAGRPAQ